MTKRTAPTKLSTFNYKIGHWASETSRFVDKFFIKEIGKNNPYVDAVSGIFMLLWALSFLIQENKDTQILFAVNRIIAFMSICFGYYFFQMQTFLSQSEINKDQKTFNYMFLASAFWTLSALVNIFFYEYKHVLAILMPALSGFNSISFLVVIKELTFFGTNDTSKIQGKIQKNWNKILITFWIAIILIIIIGLIFPEPKPDESWQFKITSIVDFALMGITTIWAFFVLFDVAGNREFNRFKILIWVAIILTTLQQFNSIIVIPKSSQDKYIYSGGMTSEEYRRIKPANPSKDKYDFSVSITEDEYKKMKQPESFLYSNHLKIVILPVLYKLTLWLVFFVLLYSYVLLRKNRSGNIDAFKYSILTLGNLHNEDTQKEGKKALNLFLGDEDFKWSVDDLVGDEGADSFTFTLMKQLTDNIFSVAVLWVVAYAAFTNKEKLANEKMPFPEAEELNNYPNYNFIGFTEKAYWELIYTLFNLFKSLRPVKHIGYISNAGFDQGKEEYVMEFKKVNIDKLRESIKEKLEYNSFASYTRDTSSNMIKLGYCLSLLTAADDSNMDKLYKRKDHFDYKLINDPDVRDTNHPDYPNDILSLIFNFDVL